MVMKRCQHLAAGEVARLREHLYHLLHPFPTIPVRTLGHQPSNPPPETVLPKLSELSLCFDREEWKVSRLNSGAGSLEGPRWQLRVNMRLRVGPIQSLWVRFSRANLIAPECSSHQADHSHLKYSHQKHRRDGLACKDPCCWVQTRGPRCRKGRWPTACPLTTTYDYYIINTHK